MRYRIFFIFFLVYQCNSFAQNKYDYTWLLGYLPNDPEHAFGGVQFIFSDGMPMQVLYHDFPQLGVLRGFTTISDKYGYSAIATNGCAFADVETGQLLFNGDSINYPGYEFESDCGFAPGGGGYNINSAFIIPMPDSEDEYYYFHPRYDFPSTPEPFYHVESLLYSKVKYGFNGGFSYVEKKNVLLIKDTLCDMLAAVRHGNGRDWWIFIPKFNSNILFKFLLTNNGISGPYNIETPISWDGEIDNFWWEQSVFSPDGKRYARANSRNDGQIFEFDRCSGEFTNAIKLSLPPELSLTAGIAFSPNSRFLYINNGYSLYQFDLNAPDVQASRILVGTYDNFVAPFPTTFNQMQLAPDNKIYMNATNGVHTIHVINNPDEKGLGCNFKQHSIDLPVHIGLGMPNYPFFRLLDFQNSPCDTLLISTNNQEKSNKSNVSVFPNPANGTLIINWGNLDVNASKILIINTIGQVLLDIQIKEGHIEQSISLEGILPGLLYWELVSEEGMKLVGGPFIKS